MNDVAPLPNHIPPRTITRFERSDDYRAQVHEAIAGGAHTYSKGDDQFPIRGPAAIARGKGGRVWDLDGNEYVDCALGLGSISLGHAYGPVLDAVRAQLDLGVNFQRPAAVELELAHALQAVIPGAERVKFAKNGSTVTTAAVKLARAFTGRDLVAFPISSPFISYDDWYIGRGKVPSGVPGSTVSMSLTYDATKPETLAALFKEHPGKIAAIITEPEELVPVPDENIREIERIARSGGALFIVDEMATGFRSGFPGAFTRLGLSPDLVTWGKGAGNGFSLCALTGRADVMDLGGIKQVGRPRVFLISTTHGGEAHALAAGLAVLDEYRRHDIIGHHRRLVARLAASFKSAIERHGLSGAIEAHASPWRIVFVTRDTKGAVSFGHRTLLMQEMIGRGVLFQGLFLPCFAHDDADTNQVERAFDASCQVYRLALEHGYERYLVGEPLRPVFRRYNGCKVSCPAEPCPHERTCKAAS
jgi:glutamate-1-semialdehyde aminotransferase